MPCGPCLIRSYLARHASHAPAQVRAVGSSRSCSPCCGRSRISRRRRRALSSDLVGLHDALLVQSCHLFDLCVSRYNFLCVSRCNYLCVSRCINAALVGLHDALFAPSVGAQSPTAGSASIHRKCCRPQPRTLSCTCRLQSSGGRYAVLSLRGSVRPLSQHACLHPDTSGSATARRHSYTLTRHSQ